MRIGIFVKPWETIGPSRVAEMVEMLEVCDMVGGGGGQAVAAVFKR